MAKNHGLIREKIGVDKVRLKDYIGGHENELDDFLERSLACFDILELNVFRAYLTTSKSIAFRLYKGDYEISFEVFYTKDDTDDDVEVVYTIYKGHVSESNRIRNNYGTLDDSVKDIKSHIS